MLSLRNFGAAPPQMNFLPPAKSSEQGENWATSKTIGSQKPFVLVFGKDQESRLLFKCTLEIWDFDTAEAGTIEESIWIAEKRSPDLVLMDTELIFSNSLSEMRQMRDCSGLLRMAPFILLSGHAQKSFRRLAFIAGATDFIKKPVDFKLLETILKTRLTDAGQKNNLRGFQ